MVNSRPGKHSTGSIYKEGIDSNEIFNFLAANLDASDKETNPLFGILEEYWKMTGFQGQPTSWK